MTAEEAAKKIAALNEERTELLSAADHHEQQARECRAKALACKKESAEWTTVLQTARVKEIVMTDQQAAAKARAEAEAHAADLARLKDEAAAALAKLKAANTPTE